MIRKQIRVYGIVQGVGFRPFIYRIAQDAHITGSVCNKGPYVEIYAQGTAEQVALFTTWIRTKAPQRSAILKMDSQAVQVKSETEFTILHSEKVKGDIFVSPDIAICDACAKELFDPQNRRYHHPFINCTACGPRLTILDSMPYDRVRTSMKKFPMCPDCEREYTTPDDRRYHAQPVCCNKCGPELYIVGKDIHGDAALQYTKSIIRNGGIAAIKGIGGFHLCCDATNEKTIAYLRSWKHRPFKPFAIMAKNMDVVKRECKVNEAQQKYMTGPQRPILLLEKQKNGLVSDLVAPDNPMLGVMLPYAPVQLLLFEGDMPDCLIMTSANSKGAPICKEDADVIENLGDLCDVVLSNDRDIRLRADDSVMAWIHDKPSMIRRSRGYAPLPMMISKSINKKVLGIGGELKNTFCLATKDLYYCSPYVGDLSDIRSVDALKQAIERMEELLEIRPETIVCDLHPRYNSVQLAKEYGLPVVPIQHHYAHILSCMAENDYLDPVIGVSMDGTGYGLDGTIWGGEILVCDVHHFERKAHITPFMQAGGDLSSKEGWRIAVSLLQDKDLCVQLGVCSAFEYDLVFQMIQKQINSVVSTSAGRLFDAVSAILGLCRINTTEAQASMLLEFEARKWQGEGMNFHGDTTALVQAIAQRMFYKDDRSYLAYSFHEGLANYIVDRVVEVRKETGLSTVACSGGVMQNQLLMDLVRNKCEENGFQVLSHSMIPCNDGGIGLGQALYGMMNGKE